MKQHFYSAGWFNDLQVHNLDTFMKYFRAHRSMLTVVNHESMLDDPLIWGQYFDHNFVVMHC